MKPKKSKTKSASKPKKKIERTLRTGGFLFPETVDEVKEFERIYGATDVILPTELQEPHFLRSQSRRKAVSASLSLSNN